MAPLESFLKKCRFFLCMAFALLPALGLWASDWVLASEEFTFSNRFNPSSTDAALSKMMPQLILEQLSSDSARLPSDDELLARALDALQTERISLFLQLSKEVRNRDSYVLVEKNPRKQKKAILAAEKKIRELEEKISLNLEETEKTRAHTKETDLSKSKNVQVTPQENVVLYKNDSSLLFVPPESAKSAGEKSRAYERAVVSAKINGLLKGSITVYGGYAAVTAELRTFPGGDAGGTVTEVGSLENTTALAQSIARALWPKVVNALPVSLIFAINPQEKASDARIAIDGTVTTLKNNETQIPSGTHTIEVSLSGYETVSITHRFVNASGFLVNVPLTEHKEGSITLFPKESAKEKSEEPFSVYASGVFLGKEAQEGILISITGSPILGQFVRPVFSIPQEEDEMPNSQNPQEDALKEDNIIEEKSETVPQNQPKKVQTGFLTSFFYIPPSLQDADTALSVKASLQDTGALIEKRRIWMYRGYTALILTLPFTFYSIGNYDSAYNAYYNGYVDAEEVYKWNTARIASAGISILAGGFFIFELVRYLHSASSVLPAEAKSAPHLKAPVIETESTEELGGT